VHVLGHLGITQALPDDMSREVAPGLHRHHHAGLERATHPQVSDPWLWDAVHAVRVAAHVVNVQTDQVPEAVREKQSRNVTGEQVFLGTEEKAHGEEMLGKDAFSQLMHLLPRDTRFHGRDDRLLHIFAHVITAYNGKMNGLTEDSGVDRASVPEE